MQTVLEGGPVRQSVDDVRCSVEEGEGLGCLGFVGRQEVWREVGEGVEESYEGFPHPVVRIVRG